MSTHRRSPGVVLAGEHARDAADTRADIEDEVARFQISKGLKVVDYRLADCAEITLADILQSGWWRQRIVRRDTVKEVGRA